MRFLSNPANTLLSLAILLCFSCKKSMKEADLIVVNASIWTGNPAMPSAEAMAIKGEKIISIGSNAQVLEYKCKETKYQNLQGKFVYPGFIDSHVHFLTGGFNLSSVQLRDAKTPQEFAQRISDFAKTVEPGTWILGGDWDHENWGGRLPHRNWIDDFTKDHPVYINRLDGHMALANSKALELAGINEQTPQVEGGEMVIDQWGWLSGIFKDNAMNLVSEHIPVAASDRTDYALKQAMDYVASKGVTSVHHMVGYMDALERARKNNTLKTRIYAMMPLSSWQDLKNKIDKQGRGDHWLKIGGLKGFVDGSLGAHTAAFHEPYTDLPEDQGFFINDESDLKKWISGADTCDLQIMVHAIGDKAINFLLDTYEEVERVNGKRDRRFRIEHAQHISPQDIPRFAQLNVIPSMQPYHAIDDGRWAEKVIGPERIKTTYAFKSLFDSGAKVAFGSDWFVAPPTPLDGIYAAVTRRTLDGANPEGWVAEQKISVEQALVAYTRNAAYASFEEDIKGTLETGKLADFVVLENDLINMNPERIMDAKILATWVGGKKVFGNGVH